MKDDIVVGRIAVVVVTPPVGSLHVDLHIAGPLRVAHLYLGVEEVGPGICVEASGVDHLHRLAGREPQTAPHHIVFP